MNDRREHREQPPDPGFEGDQSTRTVPLDLDEGPDRVIEQENLAGQRNIEGGGEFPDPHAPPSEAAPGSADMVRSPSGGGGQFAEAYEHHPDEPGEAPDDEVPRTTT
ncbi:MAG: hypothetical protein H0U89_05645 [Acidimicrobiia bacterium]|nr:hypothetical protein [Acidimicrobiia bacterium]